MNNIVTRLMCCLFVLALVGTVSAAGLITAGEQGIVELSDPVVGEHSPFPSPHPIDFCKVACILFIHPFDFRTCDKFPRC
ncbi:MAG: hypothetical protein GYA23_06650 [Methanomicrobiales archaeon]|nr:hypothetical protein [Methanomicrobiales archaeon]